MYLFTVKDDVIVTPGSLEHAYLAIISNDLGSAYEIFKLIDSPRGLWGISFVEILKGYLINMPTYMKIRNFFEIDLDFLVKNEKIEYIEYLLGSMEILALNNQEVYKYAARVMLENKFFDVAIKYMNLAKDANYKDPELHFMLSKYYIEKRDFISALNSINVCSEILPEYYPAKVLKKHIIKMLD